VFNAVLLRNLSENPNLVYNLVRAHQSFEDLGTFTLARGLREIRRKQLLKEERPRDSSDKNRSPESQSDTERRGREKARLLRSESSIDVLDDIEAQRQSASEDRMGRPLTSPTLVTASASDDPLTMPSEKTRGKMRARAESEDLTSSLERLAASGIGRNGFIPTQEWVRMLIGALLCHTYAQD
jgi:hypothetical protein